MQPISIDLSRSYQSEIYYQILVIGAGGTGGIVIQQLCQMLSMFEISAKLIIAEPDIYEEKNRNNQLCLAKDVGKNKADVLAKRYRAAYQLDIATFTGGYVEDTKTIDTLFQLNYERIPYNYRIVPILISCVDNNYSRKIFHEYFNTAQTLLYFDVGNENVILPKDHRNRPIESWTKEELEEYKDSGFTGQMVCGFKSDWKILSEPIGTLYPDILEDNDEIAPSQLSCQELAASNPQRLITNRYSAISVITVLNEIFETKSLSTHRILYHAKRGYMKSEPIIG
ncbi:ThiF family adenylyltransferase [Niallia circulans]|uniref:ThiF family adenylyltransferase n=1 Tax=Niallia circulans TaxID=1397 RepID=UPI00155FA47D|nr:ThiF family adenylyltransferase [Niallia circulans]NRG33221.1 ThiF family adenylyltransferase [Niallia circulans]